jgi:bifunctional ADP-heptose synthase (sugar kinase/adenylyltransferase)
VDFVIVFAEDDPRATLAAVRPHYHVKGGDYRPDQIPEADLVAALGAQLVIGPHVSGRSTTRLIDGLRHSGRPAE